MKISEYDYNDALSPHENNRLMWKEVNDSEELFAKKATYALFFAIFVVGLGFPTGGFFFYMLIYYWIIYNLWQDFVVGEEEPYPDRCKQITLEGNRCMNHRLRHSEKGCCAFHENRSR